MSDQSEVTDGKSLNSLTLETQVSEVQTNASDGSQPEEQATMSCPTWKARMSQYDDIPFWKWKIDRLLNKLTLVLPASDGGLLYLLRPMGPTEWVFVTHIPPKAAAK